MSNNNFTQNRELSWLCFNDRVLMEATDETVPLLERLKFISIFMSNLDEFFMIRVGGLSDIMNLKDGSVDNKSGLTPSQQLEKIYSKVHSLYEKMQKIYFDVEKQLRVHGIYQLSYDELEPNEIKYIKQYYKSSIAPLLSPQIVDTHHPFPHLQNKVIHIGAILKYKNKEVFAVIPIPNVLPEITYLVGSDTRYITTAEIIFEHLEHIFTNYTVSERVVFSITRNADINPDDDTFEFDSDDFRKRMKKLLGQRKRLAPVRLELSSAISKDFKDYLCEKLYLSDNQIFITRVPLKLNYVFQLTSKIGETKRRALTYPSFAPQIPSCINMNESIIKQIQRQDILLSFPYESMTPFLQLIKEAAYDPTVISIKITIYRLSNKAKLVEYLCNAAENGKDVTVLIELRARFDEQNNIEHSEQLEEAGCTVLYGFEEYKIHSKICLITKRERGEIKYITQIGSGNYNEKTAELYTDVSLMTANKNISLDANEFFKNMAIGNLEGSYNYLLVAPVSLKSSIMQCIDEEIAKREKGRIIIKLNSITDIDLIEKLKQASCAGVKINLIVRGICCILPNVSGKTENIEIISIVGRFLEHSRIYCFGNGSDEKIFLSSADFMTRNTQRRVEVACPIYDSASKDKLHTILDACLSDTIKARSLQSDGTYCALSNQSHNFDSQQVLLNLACNTTSATQKNSNYITKIQNFFNKLLENNA